MKTIRKISSFIDHTHDITVYVMYGTTQKEINTFFKKQGLDNTYFYLEDEEIFDPESRIPAGMVSEIHNGDNETFIIVYFTPKLKLNDSYDIGKIIGHEVMHIFLTIYGYIDATVDIDNQEPSAYFFGNLYYEVLECLSKLITKNS